jgi:alditol oxidase
MRDVEAALAPFDPRPHWGKLHSISGDDLARRFPRLRDALDLARRLDPEGKFAADDLLTSNCQQTSSRMGSEPRRSSP